MYLLTKERIRTVMLSLALLAAIVRPACADEFDQLREKWGTRLTGDGVVNPVDPDVALSIKTLSASADSSWASMDKRTDRQALWSGIADWSRSSTVTANFARLQTMALAYASVGSSLHGDPALAADICDALAWLYAKHYNERTQYSGNWWDWQIGTPLLLDNIAVLMYPQLDAARLAHYMAAIDHFVPDPTMRLKPDGKPERTLETAANLLDKSLIVALRGIVGKSPAKLVQGRNAISPAFEYVTVGDGFYRDGSFIQHDKVPYVGGYGAPLIADLARLFYLLGDSRWAITDPKVANVYGWVDQAYAPFLYDGAVMDAVRGRGVSRQFANDHMGGRSLLQSLALLAQTASPVQAARLKAMIKGQMMRDTTFSPNYLAPTAGVGSLRAAIPVYELALLKAVMNDASVAPADELVRTHVFAAMDRAVQREPGFAFVFSLFSTHISAFEYGNGENGKGWWSGIGMTNLYNGDLTQFDRDYWPTVDMARLPGTTTDHSGVGVPVDFKKYVGTSDWVGGAELDRRYAAVGMDFSTRPVTGSSLRGKKSWFLFGDKMIAVGADISSDDAAPVETMVENRKLSEHGDNTLTVDGVAQPATPGWRVDLNGAHWAHLAGTTAGADIGYYFPEAAPLHLLRETRSGSWRDINRGDSNAGNTVIVSNNYLNIAVEHGAHPQAASYSYVILPNRSAVQMADFAARPDIDILEHSAALTAVADHSLGLLGANVWSQSGAIVRAGGKELLSVDSPASILTQERDGELQVGVADPTQLNTGSITVDIQRSAQAVLAVDPGVTVLCLAPTIRLRISVEHAGGKSFGARFKL